MPWDPGWESDGVAGHAASGSASVDQGYDDENGEVMDEEETNGHYENHHLQENEEVDYVGDSQEEEEGGWEPEDSMDVDDELAQPHQHMNSMLHQDPDVTPRPKQRVVGLAVPRAAQVQVVLHSSPKKEAYTVIPDELSADELVTSDLLPGLKPKSFYKSSQPPKPLPLSEVEPSVSNTSEPTSDTPQLKKRGRPKGWRPGHGPYSTPTPGSKVKKPQGRPPGSGKPGRPPGKLKPNGEPRGKPGRKPAQTARKQYDELNPKFPVFICEWQDCPARLHNLETLRRHILIVHGHPSRSPPASPSASSVSADEPIDDGLIICEWAACHVTPTPRTEEDFRSHLEEAHLIPFAWHCGDGPQNTSAIATPQPPSELPGYLFDAEGRQVTPSMGNPEVETDEERKRRIARMHALKTLAAQNAEDEPDEPELDEAQIISIEEAMMEKLRRRQELMDYAAYVLELDGLEEGEKEERMKWRGQMV
ncbi:hypothetical protein QBC40DRAFT_276207 [Triangularia verruculosa]|uniref:C2H2-type domain-containing protein n=1 Tax=Triangularia verruculosa TaxID=2587418 RepID=A0AAN6XLL3_9PEZI|nr:hypothetical protein QBC40DRAFT_276207 [Triangularia verruculosa]